MRVRAGRAMTLLDLLGVVDWSMRRPRLAIGGAPRRCSESLVRRSGTDAEGSLAAAGEDRREGGAG